MPSDLRRVSLVDLTPPQRAQPRLDRRMRSLTQYVRASLARRQAQLRWIANHYRRLRAVAAASVEP